MLHAGFAFFWYAGEWYKFDGDDDARDILLDGFTAFSNDNPDINCRDFVYWYNGESMAKLVMAMDEQKGSLQKFQKLESTVQRGSS